MMIGAYRAIERAGIGGMAEVWRAISPEGRTVAIKRPLPHIAADAEFRRYFAEEVRVQRRFTHRHLVALLDAETAGPAPFAVLEYIDGAALRTVTNAASLGAHAARIIAQQAVAALAVLHGARVCHRDISPANVLITADGQTKLADFGLAAAADRSLHTATGRMRGTWTYLSPARLAGNPAQPADDLWALAVVLCEAAGDPLPRTLTAPTPEAALASAHAAINALPPDAAQTLEPLTGVITSPETAGGADAVAAALAAQSPRFADALAAAILSDLVHGARGAPGGEALEPTPALPG